MPVAHRDTLCFSSVYPPRTLPFRLFFCLVLFAFFVSFSLSSELLTSFSVTAFNRLSSLSLSSLDSAFVSTVFNLLLDDGSSTLSFRPSDATLSFAFACVVGLFRKSFERCEFDATTLLRRSFLCFVLRTFRSCELAFFGVFLSCDAPPVWLVAVCWSDRLADRRCRSPALSDSW